MDREPTIEEIGAFLADYQLTRERGGSLGDALARHPGVADHLPARTVPVSAPAPVVVQAPAPRRSIAPYVAAGAGAVAAVLVVGTVLTALLLAVAITAASLTITALVIRSLLNQQNRHR